MERLAFVVNKVLRLWDTLIATQLTQVRFLGMHGSGFSTTKFGLFLVPEFNKLP